MIKYLYILFCTPEVIIYGLSSGHMYMRLKIGDVKWSVLVKKVIPSRWSHQ